VLPEELFLVVFGDGQAQNIEQGGDALELLSRIPVVLDVSDAHVVVKVLDVFRLQPEHSIVIESVSQSLSCLVGHSGYDAIIEVALLQS